MGCSPTKFVRTEGQPTGEEAGEDSNATVSGDNSQCLVESAAIRTISNSVTARSARSQAIERLSKLFPTVPIRLQRERSASQIEFFRELDEKINKGPDLPLDDAGSTCTLLAT
ncbi:uncharacterized protein LOC135369331 [Ornithodoros turicata]|uniref:uncharacterized protein LOC135369331 n=1 Tax=Ornithodoros turicata TaxID=34597 RepID=UPI00313A2F67